MVLSDPTATWESPQDQDWEDFLWVREIGAPWHVKLPSRRHPTGAGKQPTGWGMSQWMNIARKKLATWSIFGNPQQILIWLVVEHGWALPLYKIWNLNVGLLFPTEWKKLSHVPNHQPDLYNYILRMEEIWHQLVDGLCSCNPILYSVSYLPTVTLPGAEFRNHPQYLPMNERFCLQSHYSDPPTIWLLNIAMENHHV